MNIEIKIPGKPIAKKRPHFFVRKKKDGGIITGAKNDQKTEEGRFQVQVIEQLPDGFKPYERDVGLLLSCFFGMPIPKSTSKKKCLEMRTGKIQHTKRPDTDNMVKFVKDCCNGIVWHDDCQVVHLQAQKAYSIIPETQIYITEL